MLQLTQDQFDTFTWNIKFTSSHWFWIGNLDKDGYGRLSLNGKDYRAARVAANLWLDMPIDCLELQPDHLCNHKNCVRPECLEVVPVATNIRRARGWIQGDDGVWLCKRGHRMEGHNIKIRKSTGCRNCRSCINFNNNWARRR